MGRTRPRSAILVDGVEEGRASASGWFVVGLDRDSPATVTIAVQTPSGLTEQSVRVGPGDFDIQRIDGLPEDQVNPQSPELLARIAAESARKAEGFSRRTDRDDFRSGFSLPLKSYRLSGRFGGQRILNGMPKTPHYGTDMAAPIGTKIYAPAAGMVCFAETGLHYEGGLTLIDHGQGLISAYLHQSQIAVRKGQLVHVGQVIGAVGMEGRATGPHLCWRMKWHGRYLDPMLMVGARPILQV